MKNILLFFIFLTSLNFAAQAQRSGDIVTLNLKNGVQTEGKIVGLKKGDYVKLKHNDGQIFTYYWYEIKSFNNESIATDVKPTSNTTITNTSTDNSQNQNNLSNEPDFESNENKKSIGLHLNLGTYTSVGVGLNLKLPLATQGLYIVPSFNYMGSKTITEGLSFFSTSETYYEWYDVNVDVHYDVVSKNDMGVYVLGGLGFGYEYFEGSTPGALFAYTEDTNTGIGLNLGGGIDLLKSKNFKPYLETKYNSFFSQLSFSLGLRF